jgi:hypothetical protein
MILHHDELTLARAYETGRGFEGLTDTQMSAIMARGRALFHWFKAHPHLHNAINLGVLVFLFGADYFVLVHLPGVFLQPGRDHAWVEILLASVVAGSLHSYLLYSLSVLSLHEGAAHRIIFVGKGWLARCAQTVSGQLCRSAGSEPEYYAGRHMAHHAKFGTEDDAEFLNFVIPRRYFLTFLPMAAILNYTDFIVHRPHAYTRGRMLSTVAASAYNLPYAYVIYQRYGVAVALLIMLVFLPHVGFYLDRIRQFTEHNLMPLDNKNGSRSFGTGFWGLLVGGGPWGSPCHWEHHLVPSLPWYQQILLHRSVVTLLTPRQRAEFLIPPVIGFPRLWWRLVRELRAFQRGSVAKPRDPAVLAAADHDHSL